MATAPSPNDLTRQQLDELDALLQKMLTAPLAVDTPPPTASLPPMAQPPLPPSWRVDPPAPAPSLAHLSLDDPPPLRFEPPAPPPAPVAKPAKAAQPAPAPPPVQAPKPVPKVAPAPAPRPPAVLTPAPAPVPPVPFVFLPFVALNGLFDNICGMFGPLGRLFRSGFFKHIYGLAGVGLLAYTALRVAQVQAWVTLPVQLPWPK